MKIVLLRHKGLSLVLIFIFLLAGFLRLNQLGQIPYGITNDEASYIYSAYSIWKTGEDVTGQFLPLSMNLGSSLSPVPIYVTAPFVGVLGISPFTGRLPFALMSLGTVLFVFLIGLELFKNKYIAAFSAFVLAISPWSLHIGRTAYDGVIAMFFYTLATYVFIKAINRKTSILWSLPLFLLAFYSYHGMKVFFVAYIPLLLFVYRDYLLPKRKMLLLFLLGIGSILLSFYIVMKFQTVTRQSVFIWNDVEPAVRQVNYEREKNSAPWVLRETLSNKPLYFLRMVRERYLHAFSTEYLFLAGDSTGIYSPYFRGEMYFIEAFFFVWGIIYLIRFREKRVRNFILLGLLVAPLPSAFTNDQNYVIRSMMMLLFLSFITGSGIYASFLWLQERRRLVFFLGSMSIVIAYILSLGSYLYQYYYRYSVYGAENWFRSHREAVEYILKERDAYKHVFIAAPNNEFLLQYGVFGKADPRAMQKAWAQGEKRTIEDVTFLPGCIDDSKQPLDPRVDLSDATLYIAEGECHRQSPTKTTIQEYGEPVTTRWRIFENF